MRHARRASLAVLCASSLIVSAGPPALGDDLSRPLPRYQFKPGQELVYRLTFEDEVRRPAEGERKREDRKQESEQEWRVYVVRQNDDGSSRLLIRKSTRKTALMPADYDPSWAQRAKRMLRGKPVRKPGEAYTDFSNAFVGYCDMHPDGRYEMNDSLGDHASFEIQPEELFCQLPPDRASLTDGWNYTAPASGADFQLSRRDPEEGGWRLCGRRIESQDAIYLVHRELCYRFDNNSALINRIEDDWQVESSRYRRRATVELKSAGMRDAAWMEKFAAEADVLMVTVKSWYESIEQATAARTVADCMSTLARARRMLTECRAKTTMLELQEAYDAAIALHDRDFDDTVAGAVQSQLLYAKAPIQWETTDLDDESHRSADYRGTVVIMDFWYRGCGHCIKAMPKIKRLAAKYEGQPVRVLGMSIDEKDEDAQFVVETLGLEYPILRSRELSDLFGVRGYPTFVVLDQTGRVVLRVFGNAESLEDTIASTVDELLDRPPG